MKYARIDNGFVAELFETGGDIAEMFHPDLIWVAIPNGVQPVVGWSYAEGTFSAPIVPGPTPEELSATIADRRYEAETAGIIVNGTHVPTDRNSQAMVTGAALAAVIDQGYTCQWKTVEGFVTLDATQIIAMATAMRTHVQACFDHEAQLLAALEAGTYTDEQLDEGWPA